MSQKFYFIFALYSYTLFVSVVLVLAEAAFMPVIALLLGAPIFMLWNRIHIGSHLVPFTAVFTIIVTAIIQLYAYKSGLWYELSPYGVQVFDGAPIEAYVLAVVSVLYQILLYEYIFDDKNSSALPKVHARGLSILGLVYAVTVGYLYTQSSLFIDYPFACLILLLSSITLILALIRQSVPKATIVIKGIYFAILNFPIMILIEWVLLENGIRIFANTNEYLYFWAWQGLVLPIEELLLLLIVPFCLVVLYEMYLDDAR